MSKNHWIRPERLFTHLLVAVLTVLPHPSEGKTSYIFKSPDSPFPSGKQALQKLQTRTHNVISQLWVKVEAKSAATSIGWIQRDDLICDQDFSSSGTVRTNALLRRNPAWTSSPNGEIPKGTLVRNLGRDQNWIHIAAGQKIRGWIESIYFQPLETSWGRALIKKNTGAHRSPRGNGSALFTLFAGTWVDIQNISGDYARVEQNNKSGYVPLQNLMTRAQAAILLEPTGSNLWANISDLSDFQITTSMGRKYKLEQVRALRLDPSICFIANDHAVVRLLPTGGAPILKRPAYLSKTTSLGEMNIRWGQSFASGHGMIWWPIESRFRLPFELSEGFARPFTQMLVSGGKRITTEELFKRKVSQLMRSENSSSYFASAQGVFRSVDGQLWEQLPIFADEDYPIATSSNGAIYIGPYVSLDQGESFEPYVRWENVLNTLARDSHMHPTQLAFLNIALKKDGINDELQLKLDVGLGQAITIRSRDQGRNWNVVNAKTPTP